MSQRLLILIIALVVIIIGGGVWWYFNQDEVSQVLSPNSNTATTNTAVDTNTDTTPVNAALKTELKGNVELDQTVTISQVPVHFSSVSKLDSFEGQAAPAGQNYVVVYIDGLDGADVLDVQRGLSTLVVLNSSAGSVSLSSLKVASNLIEGDRGYLKYLTASDATGFELIFGDTGDRFALPL